VLCEGRQLHDWCAFQGLDEHIPGRITGGQADGRSTLWPDQLAGDSQEIAPDRLERTPIEGRGQTEPLPPVEEVGGKADEMEVRDVRIPGVAGDLGQGVGFFQFADDESGVAREL